MKKYKWLLIILNLLLLIVYVNYSVIQKENILKGGQLVLLELAPVDPRSLMQGDYMSLRYNLGDGISVDSIPKRGYCVVKLNRNQVARRIRFQQRKTPLFRDEYLIAYTAANKWNISIGAESYFFEEGTANRYEQAKYGGLKIDKKGNSVLVGLYDGQPKKIN